MKILDLTLLIQIAGLLHLVLISAGVLMPSALNLRTNIAGLPPIIRQLFWVYYAFIGLCLVSFGTISVVFASALASGSNLARAMCVFLAAFWILRLVVALFVFDMRPYLTSPFRRFGYAVINFVFAYLPVVYVYAAVRKGAL